MYDPRSKMFGKDNIFAFDVNNGDRARIYSLIWRNCRKSLPLSTETLSHTPITDRLARKKKISNTNRLHSIDSLCYFLLFYSKKKKNNNNDKFQIEFFFRCLEQKIQNKYEQHNNKKHLLIWCPLSTFV